MQPSPTFLRNDLVVIVMEMQAGRTCILFTSHLLICLSLANVCILTTYFKCCKEIKVARKDFRTFYILLSGFLSSRFVPKINPVINEGSHLELAVPQLSCCNFTGLRKSKKRSADHCCFKKLLHLSRSIQLERSLVPFLVLQPLQQEGEEALPDRLERYVMLSTPQAQQTSFWTWETISM